MTSHQTVKAYRTTAIVVGVMYIAGFVVGIGGTGLIQSVLGAPDYLATVSAKSMLLALGAILWLCAVAGDAAHGVLMFPILKQHSERIAIGYLTFRILDAVFVAISVLFVLIQIPLGTEYLKGMTPNTLYLQTLSALSAQANLYAYYIGMITLGISGLMLNYIFYKARLIPRVLSIWGLAGYAIIFGGMVSAVMGSGLGDLLSLPGGLWEMATGVWLIVKGFNSFALVSQTTRTTDTAEHVLHPIATTL